MAESFLVAVFFGIILVHGKLAEEDTVCGNNWEYFNGYCYTWHSRKNEGYKQSSEQCQKLNSSLARVDRKETREFLRKTVLKTKSHFWSSLHRCHSVKFYWTDGTPMKYENFARDEPNNFQGDEDCVELYPDTSWNDQACSDRLAFVCRNTTCLNSHSESCYYKHEREGTWSEANQHCKAAGNVLVKIEDSETNIIIRNLSGEDGCWIGLRRRDYLCWATGMVATVDRSASICKESEDKCRCVAMNGDDMWGEASCLDELPYVCEKDANECNGPSNPCHLNAVCTNTDGSYTCHCKDGFIGNGKTCEDANECNAPSNPCHLNAVCSNTVWSYTCHCKDGFIGNGKICGDANECNAPSNPCHRNAVCTNTVGSYTCHCKDGFIGNGKTCEEPEDFKVTMMNTADMVEVETVITTCSNALQKGNQSEAVIKVLEDITVSVGQQMNDSHTENFSMGDENIMVGIFRVKTSEFAGMTYPNNAHRVPDDEDKIVFPASIFSPGSGDTAVIVGMVYGTPADMNNTLGTGWSVNSKTVGGIIKPEPKAPLKDPVKIEFRMMKVVKNAEARCVFWKFKEGAKGSWSTDGCQVTNFTDVHVSCECYHLTNFAILMRVQSDQTSSADNHALDIITYVGLSASILGCFLTLVIHLYFRKLRKGRGFIHINLVVALGIADIVFFVTIFTDQNQDSCLAMAILVLYFFLALFFWMLVEGLHIYLMVKKVFDITGRKIKYFYCTMGWICPLVIVVVAYGILQRSKFLSDEYCWLAIKSGAIWAFVGPITFIIVANMIIMVLVLKVTVTMLHDDPENGKIMSAFRTFLMLAPILGVTWVFGILTLTKDSEIFQYLFAILNSFQGLIIFVLYCVLNKEARREIQRKVRTIRSSRGISVTRRKSSTHSTKEKRKTSGSSSKPSYGTPTKKKSEFSETPGRYTPWYVLSKSKEDEPGVNHGYQDDQPSSSKTHTRNKQIEYPLRQKCDATGKLFNQHETPDATAETSRVSENNGGETPEIYPLEKSRV